MALLSPACLYIYFDLKKKSHTELNSVLLMDNFTQKPLLIKTFLIYHECQENYIQNLAIQNLSNAEEQIRHVKIAERVCILSYFHTTYKSMEKRAQGLNFIVCTYSSNSIPGLLTFGRTMF